MSGGDSFAGAWLVSEHVYDPDGAYRGAIDQHRDVEWVAEDRLRVTQRCYPSPALAGHPMAYFAGEWVFHLELAGTQRRYLGPDVVGAGTEWQPGVMTGQGIWPRFGYEFESYGVLVAPDRQLTGGSFSLAGRSVADIVGVAVPERCNIKPRLDLSATPPGVGHDAMLHRVVGPMQVTVAWRSPSQRLRVWAMRDPHGASGFTLTETVNDGQRSVSATVG